MIQPFHLYSFYQNFELILIILHVMNYQYLGKLHYYFVVRLVIEDPHHYLLLENHLLIDFLLTSLILIFQLLDSWLDAYLVHYPSILNKNIYIKNYGVINYDLNKELYLPV